MIYRWLFLSFFIFSTASSYGVEKKYILKTSTKDGIKKIEIDINQDGKVDRIESYRKDKMISLQIDNDFKGLFDQTTEFFEFENPQKPIQVISYDKNGDGRVDRIESTYKDPKHGLIIISHQVDTKFNGTFDNVFTTHTKLNQNKDADCNDAFNGDDLKIMKLSLDVSKVRMSLENGYYVTGTGYKIHQSCLDKWGAKEFPQLLNKSMTTGFQCLNKLAKKNSETKATPNGALKNLQNLDYLLNSSTVAVVCNDDKFNWTGTAAHASVKPGEKIEGTSVVHPFIAVNVNKPKTKLNPTQEEKDFLTSTLFHEQLHNLGFLHGESIEYPYACETCCIEDVKEDQRVDACKICSGVYTGPTDKAYLKDALAWGKSSYQSDRAGNSIIKYMKEFPSDRWAIFAYADSASDVFSPVGNEMVKILKMKFKDISADEKVFIENSDAYKDYDIHQKPDFKNLSPVLAKSYISLYYERDSVAVLDELDSKKQMIKTFLINEKMAEGSDKYIYGRMKKNMYSLLKEIWLNSYPNISSAESTRAYELLLEVGLI